MEVHWKESTVPVCQDLIRLTKTAQVTVESVVPDTKDDIGRILTVRPELYLKNKELRSRGATVSGEVSVSLLYINEAETGVSAVKASQGFTLEYELPQAGDGDLLQLRLTLSGLQARAVNPRKINVDLEIFSELVLLRRTDFVVSQEVPEDLRIPIHCQTEETSVFLPTVFCEKSFSVNEQLPFPDSVPRPKEILAKEADYRITDSSAVAGRFLIKGEVRLRVIYSTEELALPYTRDFLIPFSQLVDLNGCEAETAELWILSTADHIDLIDTIEGQKLLDAELHALLQLRGGKKQDLRYISDAYSNQMLSECSLAELPVCVDCGDTVTELNAQESVELPEEGMELLGVFPTLCQGGAPQGTLTLDLFCRGVEGKLSAMHRTVMLKTESETQDPGDFLLISCEADRDNNQLPIRIHAQKTLREQKQTTLRQVSSLILDEEQQFDLSAYPAFTAVWGRTESVWELAKQYHSSPEAILSLNADPEQRPLFLPKAK